jgi:protein gp37
MGTMAATSAIEWTDTTWNPLAGCTWASPGCDHCYAAVMARRLDAMAQADIATGRDPGHKRKYMGITNKNRAGRIMFNGKVKLDEDSLSEPLSWRKPRRVFVNSMSDLFHKDVPDSFIGKVWSVMLSTPQHTYQVLTKRPERMADVVGRLVKEGLSKGLRPPDNIWCGTSVENQEQADKRIPELLKVPAKIRFLSCEPLLGAVDLGQWIFNRQAALNKMIYGAAALNEEQADSYVAKVGIHWVICGGESGPGARPMHPEWAYSLRDQCQDAGVAFHFKQWGEYEPYEEDAQPPFWNDQHGRCIDGHWLNVLNAESGELNPGWHEDSLHSPYAFKRVGKHAAGRLLDGREWNEFPLSD